MSEKTKITALRMALGGCVLLLLIGHFLPWATHRTAALTLSANDLGFFTNFTPGAGIFLNEWFYVSVWVAALLLVLMVLMFGSGLAPINRVLLLALALGIASLGLPHYEQLIKFVRTPMLAVRESGFTLQLVLTAVVMALVVLLAARPSRANPPSKAQVFILGSAALWCAVPLIGFLAIRPFIAELYRDAVGIGSGWWLTLLADLLLWTATFATILNARSAHRTPNIRRTD